MRSTFLMLPCLGVLAGAVVALGYSTPAHACGGTFCDVGPQAMPVDQSGENILFVMGETTVGVYIQIQYDPTTTAEKFAWLVPVTQLPSFEVGSDRLFTNVLSSTVPAYGFTNTFDDCGFGDGGATSTAGGSGGDSGGDTTGGGGGPEVVYEDTVGAFDIVVLQGGTAQEVYDWLAANDYEQDMDALPILEEYLLEGYLFAAFKLTNGADTDEIHPLGMMFDNEDEGCIPIRLTRIAALEDMDIRAFFLADDRVVPENYRHVLVDPLQLDWPNRASNYKEVITMAVDANQADGHAFVTEYAGTSDVVGRSGIFDPQWDAAPFVTADPVDVVDILMAQGLLFCYEDFDGFVCDYQHTLIGGLLQQWLPVPAGLDEGDFYGCLSCNAGLIDPMAWDGAAFAMAVQERIIDPGAKAVDLLDSFPTLTRMYTTISPGEMYIDPFFYQNPDLPGVDLTNQVANRRFLCNGAALWTLPDGRQVYAPNPGVWPNINDDLPFEEEVQEIAAAGGPVTLVSQTNTIDTMLFEWNCQFGFPTPDACGDAVGETDGMATDGGTDTEATAGQNDGRLDDGCGCRTTPGTGAAPWGLLGLVWLGRRRRRASGCRWSCGSCGRRLRPRRDTPAGPRARPWPARAAPDRRR